MKNNRVGGVGKAAVAAAIKLAKSLPKVKSFAAPVEDGNAGSRALFKHFDNNPSSEVDHPAVEGDVTLAGCLVKAVAGNLWGGVERGIGGAPERGIR